MTTDFDTVRSEAEVFADLTRLASTDGYIHAIARICLRDNVISIGKEMVSSDIARQFSDERLLRTEISTLIGLLVKAPFSLNEPQSRTLENMIECTDALMAELHKCMYAPARDYIRNRLSEGREKIAFDQGMFIREAIFYGGESAYQIQYRDLAVPKYAADDDWLNANKGFSISDAKAVVASVLDIQNEKLNPTSRDALNSSLQRWGTLFPFVFTVQEVIEKTGAAANVVDAILDAFSIAQQYENSTFSSVSEFNVTNAKPLLFVGNGTYISFQYYSFAEALYESPFYWMLEDDTYSAIANTHRGEFAEEYSTARLITVFGSNRVYKNVNIYEGKNIVGEIDVLVLFGNRAIIIQAKSKRLTVESRKGNDSQLRDDFRKGIQSAYDQGVSCAKLLDRANVRLVTNSGVVVKTTVPLKEIFVLCVVSEHYPALALQARHFLNTETTSVIRPPFVMDVFTLDVIAEMLNSPLQFLSYINRRVGYSDRVMSSHEMTILSYHLKQNLWIDKETDLIQLHDDISADLDVAMLARREGIPGRRTPDGILTRISQSNVGRILRTIEYMEDPMTIDLGFMLLTLSGSTIDQLNAGIDAVCERSKFDGYHHDVTIGVGGGTTGITVHANFESEPHARERLVRHCEKRKYSQRADTWHGLCLDPNSKDVRFGAGLNYPWARSEEMDKVVETLPRGGKNLNLKTYVRPGRRKIGRNEPCPCGSGKKYKRCCMER